MFKDSKMETIKEMVMNEKKANFVRYNDGNLIYETESGFEFPISVEEAKGGTFNAQHKAVTLMRWIRKQIEVIEEEKS